MRSTAMRTNAVARWPVRWVSLCLVLFVAACIPAPVPSAITTASGPAQRTAIAGYHGHTSTVFTVAWSPDGMRIASGGNDNTVQVWDAKSGQHLLTHPGHTAPVRGVAWSLDGTHIASASRDGTVQVWDAASGQAAPIWDVAWSPSGVCLASATGNTGEEHPRETVQVWNAMTGHLLMSYPIPSSTAYADGTLSVAWSPDGMRLASGGADTMVHLWNAPSSCRM